MPLAGSFSMAVTPACATAASRRSPSLSSASSKLNPAMTGASDGAASRILSSMPDVRKRAGRIKAFPVVTNDAGGVASWVMDEPIQIPIDGVLDLHTFSPREIKDLVTDYLAACQERGILQVRIIHGKGIGNLKRTVHSILSKHPEVVSFTLDHSQYGGWGATIVGLRGV